MASCHKNECDERVSEFSTDRVFKSRQDLMDWVQNVGCSLGYVIVTKRSKNNPSGYLSKVMLMCDRGGICRSKSSIRIARNKKINCPFELVGKYYKMHDFWTLTVICEKHNHEPLQHMEGHPYARRLSKDEARLVLDLSKKNVKPSEILSILKEKNTNNFSTMRTIYNALQKFRKTGNAEVSMGQPTNCEENASTSSVYAFDGNKLKRAIDCTDRFGIPCEKKTFVEQLVNNLKSVSANLMCTARTFDANKSERTIDHMDQFAIPNTCETQTFTEKPINHEGSASLNTMYTGYAFDANKSTRTIDYMNPFSVPNSSEIRTLMGQPIKCEEGATSSPVYTAYTFDADKSKGTTDHMDPFAVENWGQELYSAKYGSAIKDVEGHLLRKQMLLQRRFPSLQTDLIETNPVKDISIANLVRDAVMCHDTSVPDAALIAVPDDNEPTFARPFQPYRDIVLNKLDGQFLMKQFLDGGYAHDQFSMGNSGGEEGEGVEENRLNTAAESVDKEDKDRNIDSDVEVAKKHDKGEYVGVQPDSKQMASFHPNKATQGDEYERNLAVKGTSGFSTNKIFKSRQDLMDWVQNVGLSLGYVIVTRRSKSKPSGYVSKVMLMCDRGGICKSKSSIRTARSKKINCPFELVGKYYKVHDFWTLEVICEKHNHEPALDMAGHPYAMRLSKDEARLVLDLSNKNVKPQEILSVLKEQNTNNLSTMRTIYNARQKFRRTEHAEISMGLPINDEESASPSPVHTKYASDANKSESTIDHTDPSRILNTCEIKAFMEQSIKNVESASTNPMRTAYIFD